MPFERRSFAATIELREDGGKPRIVGHAAVFNSLSENLGGFREQILPGAFLEAIEKDDVRALFNHDSNIILGRNLAKTLELKEDSRGLAIDVIAPETQLVRDMVLEPIRRGDISQMSFGFMVRPGGVDWAQDDDGNIVRTLKRLRLFDVSPVTFPAYPQTDVALRELRDWRSGRPGQIPEADRSGRCVDCEKLSRSLSRIEDRLALLSMHTPH